uniref:Translocase of outer mitochondrial membrane 40 like n=1 Tax=Suricata suricatta TaxID=37032 RepID=A0A673U9M9_SURSU
PHGGVPHCGRGCGQQWQPQRPGPAPVGRAAPSQGGLPGDPRPPPPPAGASPRASCSGGSRERSRGNSDGEGGGRFHSVFSLLQTQQAKFLTWQFDGEYRGDDYTATLTLGNPDLIGESEPHPPAGAGRRASLSPAARRRGRHLDAGWEVLGYGVRGPQPQGRGRSDLGEGSGPVSCCSNAPCLLPFGSTALHWVATLNVGSGGAHASYYHRANEQVQVGVEFEANTRLQDTTFSFGYHLTLPQANMVFRGLVDSNWCVGAVLEKKMPPLPVTLALGAFLNHWRNRFHCGFSITVG